MAQASPLWHALRYLSRLMAISAWRSHAHGVRHVPPRGGVLIAATHQSFLDPVLIGSVVDRPVRFLARAELFRWAPFGWLIRNLGAVPVRQGTSDRAAIGEAIRILKERHCLVVFPEGGRTKDGRIAAAQPGFALIARRAGVPVIPARVWGAYRAWPWHRLLPRPGILRVALGPPLELGEDRDATIRALHDAWADLGRILGPERPPVRHNSL